jgi:hypothetical protein
MMKQTTRAAALIAASMLTLAGCGGRPDETPAQAEVHTGSPVAPAAQAIADGTPTASANAASASGDDLTQLRQQVALLRREVADVRQQLARMPAGTLVADTTPDPRTDANARAEAERADQLRLASTESAFRREENDMRWSRDTTASVRSALSGVDEALRNQVRSVECRSQSCRVEISSEGGGAVGQELPVILARLAPSLPNVTAGQIDQGNGRQATVLYLSR